MTNSIDSLHITSLRLVGRTPCSGLYTSDSALETTSYVDSHDGPWDEVDYQMDTIKSRMSGSKSNKQGLSASTWEETSFISKLVGPEESRWRVHGATRREQLLEEDRQKGGQTFTLSYETTVHRYFSIAHWALEQFHQLYQTETDHEETYVMGHRIVAFLTECLPKHPGFRRSAEVRQRTKVELDLLRKCLEDVALQIDENICNQFVDEFDPIRVVGDDDEDGDDSDDDSATEDSTLEDEVDGQLAALKISPHVGDSKSSPSDTSSEGKKRRMVRFGDWVDFPSEMQESITYAEHDRKLAESPTADTVGTSGTGSLEPVDSSYTSCFSDGNDNQTSDGCGQETDPYADLPDREYFDENAAFPSPHRLYSKINVRLDFLDRIANEEVTYETDSDAADSWAQTPEETSPFRRPPSSSGETPTCDPARIAFRDLMNKLPQSSIIQDFQRDRISTLNHLRRDKDLRKDSSPETAYLNHELEQNNGETAQQVTSEIRRYLESDEDKDPTKCLESCHDKLKVNSPTKARSQAVILSSSSSFASYSSSSSDSSSVASFNSREADSAFRPYNATSQQRKKLPRRKLFEEAADPAFLEDENWISFDNSNMRGQLNFFSSRKT